MKGCGCKACRTDRELRAEVERWKSDADTTRQAHVTTHARMTELEGQVEHLTRELERHAGWKKVFACGHANVGCCVFCAVEHAERLTRCLEIATKALTCIGWPVHICACGKPEMHAVARVANEALAEIEKARKTG